MKLAVAAALLLALSSLPASADPEEARTKLLTLPHADVAHLVGSWQVKEMEPIKMIYEFQSDTMAMHGLNSQGGASFEMTMDADYRRAGDKAIWVIGTHPRPVPDDMGDGANNPSILGIEFTADNQVTMTVSAGERFTLVKVP
ncbi:MAG: hypothetical protein JWM91_2677 [Rhodospirillales bacterium]|nr:hypothetical protein [Rhodospirillales bacterium]